MFDLSKNKIGSTKGTKYFHLKIMEAVTQTSVQGSWSLTKQGNWLSCKL